MDTKQLEEKYAYFTPQDIAAMCVDIAMYLNNKDLSFIEKRKIRNIITNDSNYNQRLVEISKLINSLGKEITNLV
jgi:hypothetical protein